MKKRFLEITLLLFLITILITIAFYPYIFKNIPYMGGYDVRSIYRPLYEEYRVLINNSIFQKTLPFWSWNTFLGNNFWSSKSYYLIGDVYNYLLIFLDLHFYVIFLIITILKFYVSSILFYLYGSYRKWDVKWIIIGSLFFSFSAWSLEYVEQPMFLSFYSFLPLYFYAIERILQEKKYILYSFTVLLLICINYYLFLTLTICSILYYLYRYAEINGNLEKSIKSILKVIPYYFIGVGLSSPLIIPSALFILLNDRVYTTSFDFWFFNDYRIYIHLFTSLFIPSSTFITKSIIINGETFFTSLFEPSPYQLREIMTWAGSITSLTVIYSLFDEDIFMRNLNRLFYLILLFISIIPVGNAFMHGLIEPTFRWLMFPTFMNIAISLNYLNKINNIDFMIVKKTVIVICIFLIAFLVLMIFNASYPVNVYFSQILIFVISISSIVLTYICLLYKKTKLLLLISFIEITLVGYLSINNYQSVTSFTWEYINNYESVLGQKGELTNYITENFNEKEYYRIYAPEDTIYWYMSLNTNLLYNYSDIKTYDSTYQPELKKLAQWLPELRPLPQTWNIKNPDLIDFLSIKYAITTSLDQLPHNNFELIGEYRGLPIYLNKQYRPVFQNVHKILKLEEIGTKKSSIIRDYGIVEKKYFDMIESQLKSRKSLIGTNINLYQNMITTNFDADETTFVISSIAYDSGWQVYVDDMLIEKYPANGGFVSFVVPKGSHRIKLYFQPKGFKLGVYLSLFSLFFIVINTLYAFYLKSRKEIRK